MNKVLRFLALTLTVVMLFGMTAALAEAVPAATYDQYGLDENLKFKETKTITVEVYDRSVDDGPAPDNSVYTDFIKQGMLDKHNVAVEFVRVPRWTEPQDIANLLAAGSAPDICLTYQYNVVQTYGQMGGVLDLSEYLVDLQSWLPNLYDLLQEDLIFWDKDVEDGHVWAVEARRVDTWQQNTFVREDWLKKLGLEIPTTFQEFEDTLLAFKDNAELLLGADADKMIPFEFTYDASFRWQPILDSLTPDAFSDRDLYISSIDDRKFGWPAAKETARILNKWYNLGLCWNDFAMYDASTLGTLEDDMLKAGYIGSFIHNSDYPYRNGADSIHNALKRLIGDDAAFVSINPFPNDSGKVVRWAPAIASDRKVFFPSTNDEPIASLLYLDWISTLENRMFLQIGEEGVTHEVMPDGAIKVIGISGDKKMNSVSNIDYTITINGLDFGDPELKVKSQALNYDNTDPSYVNQFIHDYLDFARPAKALLTGVTIEAAEGIMQELANKRDAILGQAITASVDQFDAIWDAGVADYMRSGGQAIKDERAEKWLKYYGDVDTMPED
ncbi:hypothetical protein AGMMS49992_10410 [Clostridia bacterium]|nr:hypothetical protein AGMMS49992_10410 [Clostridia bacterium]